MKHILLILLGCVAACGDSGESNAEFTKAVVTSMHDSIASDLADLQQAARDLQAAAPTPSGRGWDATLDATAIDAMKAAWVRTRTSYEHVEGATAPIFPMADVTMDARYDDFLTMLGTAGDPDAFDGTGVTGMHGIERILYAPGIRPEVIAFESTLPGYRAAAFPATEAEAAEFKTGIAQKLIDDADALHDQWVSAATIDIGAAYQGLVGLMNEQKEKVNLAATGEEESRYANDTLFDLRNNLDGTKKVYELFRDWIAARNGDPDDTAIEEKFTSLSALYDSNAGDALPPVPATWSSDNPTAADQATPFGMLWVQVHADVDPQTAGSIVFSMNQIATLLGFPQFEEN